MLCCCRDYQPSEAPLTPLFGLNWYVTAGKQFFFFFARRGNASPVARVSSLAFLVRFAHAFARLKNALRLRIMARCGQGGCDIVSSKYTAKTLSPSPKLEKLYSNQQRLKL